MNSIASRMIAWLVASVAHLLRWTCRVQFHNDPREAISSAGLGHVFATVHANQIGGLLAAQPGTCAMVSRSADGQIVVPALLVCGHVPIRGSSGQGRKGGAAALHEMIDQVRQGRPGMMTVDGPRGPRGCAQKGIGMLAAKSDAVVLPTIVVATRRWILKRTWDRLQIPLPFSTIHVHIAPPMRPEPSESYGEFAKRLQQCLHELETQWDPSEAAWSHIDESTRVETKNHRAA